MMPEVLKMCVFAVDARSAKEEEKGKGGLTGIRSMSMPCENLQGLFFCDLLVIARRRATSGSIAAGQGQGLFRNLVLYVPSARGIRLQQGPVC